MKKGRQKAKNPRRPVFDRALEEAQRKLAKAKEIQLKSQEKLVWASQEIPRLEGIIRAFGGKSDIGRGKTPPSLLAVGFPSPDSAFGQRPRDQEILPDIPVAATDDDNRFLPDV